MAGPLSARCCEDDAGGDDAGDTSDEAEGRRRRASDAPPFRSICSGQREERIGSVLLPLRALLLLPLPPLLLSVPCTEPPLQLYAASMQLWSASALWLPRLGGG